MTHASMWATESTRRADYRRSSATTTTTPKTTRIHRLSRRRRGDTLFSRANGSRSSRGLLSCAFFRRRSCVPSAVRRASAATSGPRCYAASASSVAPARTKTRLRTSLRTATARRSTPRRSALTVVITTRATVPATSTLAMRSPHRRTGARPVPVRPTEPGSCLFYYKDMAELLVHTQPRAQRARYDQGMGHRREASA